MFLADSFCCGFDSGEIRQVEFVVVDTVNWEYQ